MLSGATDEDYANHYPHESTHGLRVDTKNQGGSYAEVLGLSSRPLADDSKRREGSPRDSQTPDSPTIPHTIAPGEGEEWLQDMILYEPMRGDGNHSLSPLPGPPPSGPPPGYGSVTASLRLDAYIHSLSQSIVPRSPALRPAASDIQGTIAFLQWEVMLLKNHLNFKRYLKRQHLSHIGDLQRKHIREETAEAETQNLINTNKRLKAKLEETKK